MSFLPFGRVSNLPSPIRLSRIQLRLAIELAAQDAVRAELRRQLAEALGCPADKIQIDGAIVDLNVNSDPEINIHGIPVVWED